MTSDTKGLDKRYLRVTSIYDLDNKLLGYKDSYSGSDKMVPVKLNKGGSVNKMMYGGMAKKKMMMGGYAKKNKKK
jgi:hypothetical protein